MPHKYLSDRDMEDILNNDSDLEEISQVEGFEESDDISEGQSEQWS